MKKFALLNAAFLIALFIFPFLSEMEKSATFDVASYKAKRIVSCTPDRNELSILLDETDIPLMPGSGSYRWKISSGSDSAQLYFNQGINMYYGFHIIESLASLKKAARFDPENPVIWWAVALAYGPNINDVEYKTSPDAITATKKAIALMEKGTPVEQALIKAISVRYSEDSLETREKLNQLYLDAMKDAYEKHPASADVMALYVDALMLQHPWDFWNPGGTPKPWTLAIQKILEKGLTQFPMHPGANHYYIHIIEASPYAHKGLRSADLLGKLTPGLSHMVHMPSHIYLRTGDFNKGSLINEEAVKRFKEYRDLFPAVNEGSFLYQLHNDHMKVNCAMQAGRYNYARESVLEMQNSVDTSWLSFKGPMGSLIQYMYMTPVLVYVRFEKWDSLLMLQKPMGHHVYANILYHFGRGMAQAGKNNIDEAKREAMQLEVLMKNEDLKIPLSPFSAAIEGAICGDEILKGFIALKENKTGEAILHFNKAVSQEESMVYNEPRDWLLNPKPYLGSAYLTAKKYVNAEQAYKKDLGVNAKNVWALYGLHRSLQKQNKKDQASIIKKQFDKATEKSDVSYLSLFF